MKWVSEPPFCSPQRPTLVLSERDAGGGTDFRERKGLHHAAEQKKADNEATPL